MTEMLEGVELLKTLTRLRPKLQDDDRLLAEDGNSREQRRSRAKHPRRARTVSMKRMTRRDLEIGRLMYPEPIQWRPRRRRDCESGCRPCPFVACKYNLYLDVLPSTGAIKFNFPDLEPHEMVYSCALDEAERGGLTLEDAGDRLNVTRERLRQIEVRIRARVTGSPTARLLFNELGDSHVPDPRDVTVEVDDE